MFLSSCSFSQRLSWLSVRFSAFLKDFPLFSDIFVCFSKMLRFFRWIFVVLSESAVFSQCLHCCLGEVPWFPNTHCCELAGYHMLVGAHSSCGCCAGAADACPAAATNMSLRYCTARPALMRLVRGRVAPWFCSSGPWFWGVVPIGAELIRMTIDSDWFSTGASRGHCIAEAGLPPARLGASPTCR